MFLCWGNLRISGLLQVLAEVENTSTAIQWSLQTHVRDHLAKQFATLSVSELLVPPVTQLTKYQAW